MGISIHRDVLSREVVGRNSDTIRVVGLMDFREEVESGNARIMGVEERDVLVGKTF